jgi:UDP-galactopyranose mutase
MEETKKFKKAKIVEESKESINPNNIKKIALIGFGGAILIYFLILLFNKLYRYYGNHYDYLIVGSGLYGATFNYFAKKAGKKTLVIEKRNVTGGSLYCENIEGIWVHKYGPHIFHTNNKTIWDLVNSIVEFTPFQYQPLTKVKNKVYNSQFTMWTFNQVWGVQQPQQAKKKIEKQKHKGEIYDLQDQGMTFIGKDLYKMFLKGYIQKEWRRDDEDLPPFIIPYLPTIYRYDTSYLNDTYQGIPVGCYNALFDKLLNDTEIHFNVDYLKNKEKYKNIADKIIYTGKIDEYFNYAIIPLDYRTGRWDIKIKDTDNYQGTSVIHYPDLDVPYIRTIEYKHFEPHNKEVQEKKKTIIGYEYVEEWNENKEPLYSINDERNNNIYLKYKEMAEKEKNVIFKGRLAEYKNYNMQDIFEDVYNQFN